MDERHAAEFRKDFELRATFERRDASQDQATPLSRAYEEMSKPRPPVAVVGSRALGVPTTPGNRMVYEVNMINSDYRKGAPKQ